MTKTALFLSPLDNLFFRDGRAFGASTRVVSGLPNPGSLLGALRAAVLSHYQADFATLGAAMREGASLKEAFCRAGAPSWVAELSVRGPWIAELRRNQPPGVYFPRPKHLRPSPGGFGPAQPLQDGLPGWRSDLKLLPLWRRDTGTTKVPGSLDLVGLEGLSRILAGDCLEASQLVAIADLVALHGRTGIQIDPSYCTAAERMIFSIQMLALRPGAGFYCEVSSAEPLSLGEVFSFPFGGESRYVRAERVPEIRWPTPISGPRRLIVLISPGLFQKGWIPDTLPREQLRSAAVAGPFAVSGWDLARGGPKATRFGVEAGSAYFCEGSADLAPSLCGDPSDAIQGYGDYLQGTWNYA